MKRTSTWLGLTLGLLVTAACDDGLDGEQELGSADRCAPMDAQGSGQCDLSQGVIVTADGCTGIAGCECVGADCDLVFANYDECAATCLERDCGPDRACPDQGTCVEGSCVYP